MDENETVKEATIVPKTKNKRKDSKNRSNDEVKVKRQEKLQKVRRMFQDRLSNKLAFFNSIETVSKTHRASGSKSFADKVKGNKINENVEIKDATKDPK